MREVFVRPTHQQLDQLAAVLTLDLEPAFGIIPAEVGDPSVPARSRCREPLDHQRGHRVGDRVTLLPETALAATTARAIASST